MLDQYIDLLNQGEIVAFPTETVYGLGADAWNPAAIQKVFAQKGRPADNPLIVHVSSVSMAEEFTGQFSKDALKLMEQFWPGPLTLIFSKKPEVLDLITAGLQTVAIRWPRHQLAQNLISQAGPLVAPSANTSGKPSPTKADHVKEDFGSDFPVIEGGDTDIGLESTVLDISRTPYSIYRPGAISAGEIEHVIGKKTQQNPPSTDTTAKSPGTKYTHYAPKATVRWLSSNEEADNLQTLYLFHSENISSAEKNKVCYNGNYKRLAHELYDRFRQADHKGYASIAIEPLPENLENPLIPALANRIQKAVSQ